MPARLPLLIVLASVSFSVSAQPTLLAHRASVSPQPVALSLAPYAGTYITENGSVELAETRGGLEVIAVGAPVAAALADLSTTATGLDARASDLLTAWVAGDTAPLAAAVAPDRQPVAEADFNATRSALTRRLGAMTQVEVLGTFRQVSGSRATLARLHFEHGAEWISLVWTDASDLATLRRGLTPVIAGIAYPTGRDTFDMEGLPVTFERDATGRIHTVAIGRQLEATR